MKTWESLVNAKKGVYTTNEGWVLRTTFKIRPQDLPMLVQPHRKIGEIQHALDQYYGSRCWLMARTPMYLLESVDNIAMTVVVRQLPRLTKCTPAIPIQLWRYPLTRSRSGTNLAWMLLSPTGVIKENDNA